MRLNKFPGALGAIPKNEKGSTVTSGSRSQALGVYVALRMVLGYRLGCQFRLEICPILMASLCVFPYFAPARRNGLKCVLNLSAPPSPLLHRGSGASPRPFGRGNRPSHESSVSRIFAFFANGRETSSLQVHHSRFPIPYSLVSIPSAFPRRTQYQTSPAPIYPR